ncbi:uncharacterized protein LOC143183650 isoform X2 [Calliopsis andreniformis]|uniref:uncharacterized protein LOC143183650 isoform X2 n=1 Tax=Calliopsis andreniformis TaxID=337506 RepID=UPI003FCE114B
MSTALANVRPLQTLEIHTSDVTSIDFAANRVLVTGSGDKRVRVWRWQPNEGYVETSFSPLIGHKYGVTSVKVSPRSTMLASASIDGTTLLWNLRTGSKIHVMVQANGEAVRVCRFSPDSTLLVTAGDSGQVCLWDLARRDLIRCFRKHEGAVRSVCFSPDSSWLVTTCSFGVLKLFSTADIVDPCRVPENRHHHRETVTVFAWVDDAHDLGVVSCDFSPSQEITSYEPFAKLYRLVTCGNDHCVKLWKITVVRTKSAVQPFAADISISRIMEKHSSALTCVRFDANGSYIASSGLDKTTVIWETNTGKVLAITSGHDRYVACCAFSRDGSLLATGSNDKSIIIWDLTGNLSIDFQLVRHCLSTRQFLDHDHQESAEYERLMIENGKMSTDNVRLIQTLREHTGVINSVAFYGNHLIASGFGDKLIRVWSIESEIKEQENKEEDEKAEEEEQEEVREEEQIKEQMEEEEGEEKEKEEGKREEEENEEERENSTEEDEKENSLFAVKFQEKPYSPLDGHKYSVNHVEFSPCGTMLASCSLDGTAIVWDTESGCRARSSFLNSGSGIRVCRWSPDGTKIATAGDDERTTLWNVNDMEELWGHSDAVNAIAFTHDSRYLVTACNEGTWRLFDTICHENCVAALMTCDEAHDLGVQGCDFSPTSGTIFAGRRMDMNTDEQYYLLATSGNDSLVKLWRIMICNEENKIATATATTGYYTEGNARYEEAKILSGHGGNVTCVRFSPTRGETLGSVATDRTARIWSVYSGACLYVLEEHGSLVTSCAFSEDASLFVTGALDKTVLIWKIPQRLISRNALIDDLRRDGKKVADWRVDDTLRWLNETGLSALARKACAIALIGRQLLTVSEEELIGKLQIKEDKEITEAFKTQLYWLKREDSDTMEISLDDVDVPHEFLCPITREIMKEPVRCSDGFTYERGAINEWFLCGKFTSPMTNEPLRNTSFTPNVMLRNAIYAFLHGDRPRS